jgi:hypothetical protein
MLNPQDDPRVGFGVQVRQELCGLADAPEEPPRYRSSTAFEKIAANLQATVIIRHNERDVGKLPAVPASAK